MHLHVCMVPRSHGVYVGMHIQYMCALVYFTHVHISEISYIPPWCTVASSSLLSSSEELSSPTYLVSHVGRRGRGEVQVHQGGMQESKVSLALEITRIPGVEDRE